MDADCIRVVTGGRRATARLLALRFDKIFFTGSTRLAKAVAAAAAKHLTPVVLNNTTPGVGSSSSSSSSSSSRSSSSDSTNSKSPCLVDASCADLAVAAKRVAWGGLANGGQTRARPGQRATLEEEVRVLRSAFCDDKTRSKEWRIHQLKALRTLLKEGRQELCDAMSADLGKSAFEGYLTEINVVEQEIYGALANLDSWMRPKTVVTDLLNAPAQSKIYSDPLGVVLVMGAWDYNVMLSLTPLVRAAQMTGTPSRSLQ